MGDTPGHLRRDDFVSSSRRGIRDARQTRSQATFEQIIDAAIELCDGRDFGTVSVSDICDRAQVSPSSFYARFRDRDAVFRALHERYLDAMFGELASAFSNPQQVGSPHALVQEIGRGFLETAGRMEPFLSTVRRTEPDHPGLMDRRLAFERRGVEALAAAVDSRAARLDPPVAIDRTRLVVALTSLHATVREMMSSLDPADVSGLGTERYLTALADQFCAYTGLPAGPATHATEAAGGSDAPISGADA